MEKVGSSWRKIISMLVLVLAGETIFFLPFVLLRIFKPTFLRVFDTDNLTLGWFFSIYGITALISYFFGGILADKFSARKLMSVALWLTALGGFALMQIPSDESLALLYGFWGITTIMLFWSAMLKATSHWGKSSTQNRAFGFLESGRGLAGALVATVLIAIMNPDNVEISTKSFQLIIGATAGITALVGVLTWFFVGRESEQGIVRKKLDLEDVWRLCRSKKIILQGILIVCAYVGYKTTDDFSLYANEVLKFDESDSALIASVAFWLRPVFALVAVYFADKFQTARFISWSFMLMVISGAMVGFGWFNGLVPMTLILLSSTAVGIYGIRSVYFALVEQANPDKNHLGTVIGIISVVGFTPDIFMGPLTGKLLDSNPGALGHQYLFAVMAAFALLGYLAVYLLRKEIRTQ